MGKFGKYYLHDWYARKRDTTVPWSFAITKGFRMVWDFRPFFCLQYLSVPFFLGWGGVKTNPA